MPEAERVLQVRQGVEKAEEDWRAVEIPMRAEEELPASAICFHAQQCVEKHLKAWLTSRGVLFPKTHDLAQLVDLLPEPFDLRLNQQEQDALTAYAVGTRYASRTVGIEETREAVQIARAAREDLRKLLPEAALS
ncbi:MAG TPA: HEPN domain-containing protein [Terriglobales bacterium]|nr:HEPN domain-containing protein [Terriglobales bacterium]